MKNLRNHLIVELIVAVACGVASSSASAALLYLQEDFQEATLGGTFTPPGGPDTTGITPTIGSTVFGVNGLAGDSAVIQAGINSTKGFASTDTVTTGSGSLNFQLRTDLTRPTNGVVQADFLFHAIDASARVSNPTPLRLRLYNDNLQQSMNFGPQLLSPSSFTGFANDNATHSFAANALSNDVPYRVQIFFDYAQGTDGKYSVIVSNLLNSTLVGSYLGGSFIAGQTSKRLGFVIFNFGSSDFAANTSGSPEYVLIDNLLVQEVVPEPGTLALFGLGGLVFWVRRRWRNEASNLRACKLMRT